MRFATTIVLSALLVATPVFSAPIPGPEPEPFSFRKFIGGAVKAVKVAAPYVKAVAGAAGWKREEQELGSSLYQRDVEDDMIMERGIQGEEELFERDLDNVEVFERDFQELDELD